MGVITIRNNQTGETRQIDSSQLPSYGLQDPNPAPSVGGLLNNAVSNAGGYIKNLGNMEQLNNSINPGNLISNPLQYFSNIINAGKTFAGIPGNIVNQGKEIISNPGQYAYQHPLDTLGLVMGAKGLLTGGGEAAASNAVDTGASDAGYTIPKVAQAAEGDLASTANTARNVIAPKVGGNAIGALSKEQAIAQDVMDVSHGFNDTSMAKSIEGLYKQVNTKLDNVLSKASDTVGKIQVNPNEGNNLLDNLTAGLEQSEAGGDPNMIAQVRNRVESFIRPQEVNPNQANFTTTIEGINNARVQINNVLDAWYKRGSPMATPQDYQNSLLAQVNQNISDYVAQRVPEAQELVNTQARLIPAYKGLYNQLTPQSSDYVGLSPYRIAGHAIGNIINPAKILLSRNPNSLFAQRLGSILGDGGNIPAMASQGGVSSLPFLLNPALRLASPQQNTP